MKRLTLFILILLLAFPWASAESHLPYTVSLSKGTAIHSGPGAGYAFVQSLGEDGVYTIVEEGYDPENDLWGKLKSGVGWVQLSGNLPRTLSLSTGTAVRTGPGYGFDISQTLGSDGVFTITEEIRDESGNPWGRLKSGAGWVALNNSPYTIPLYADTAICGGPGHDYGVAQVLEEDGMFTIVEEAWDPDGNLWGRLKSGAGWVLLKARSTMVFAPVFADYASDILLSGDIEHRLIADDSEYAVHIAFFAGEALKDVAFTALNFAGDDYEVSELLYSIDELHADTPFVASVAFPGDMTAYGIAFTDANGEMRRYTVSISGKDGSLQLNEQN